MPSLRSSIALAFAVFGCVGSAAAQPASRPYSFEAPLTDTLHALIVFVRFPDDVSPDPPGPNHRGWPLDPPGRLPAFAHSLLSPSPQPPFPDSSLTAYFHEQSLGRFVLYGEPYDSVLIAAHPEARYHAPNGGYGDLSLEILQRIDAYGFDFREYDRNGDDALDHVFMVIRGDRERDAKRFVWTGASCLDGRCAGAGTQRKALPSLELDGKRVDWNTSGSLILHRTPGNIIPQMYHVRLMAHELGHDLWGPYFVHLPPLNDNDVPASSNRSRQGHCVGYVLMAGAGGAMDCGGHHIVSAFERDLLGWIACTPLTTSRDAVRLGDLYTEDACFTVALPGDRTLYLTNHQRLGAFDRYRRQGAFEMGLLRTTGLQVSLAHRNRLDVIPADNSLDLGTENAVYDGDLFGPKTRRQLTPWTRPNSDGYTRLPPREGGTWVAIDDIRETADRAIRFDVLIDFRERPIVREESWIGRESDEEIFTAPILVRDRSTLHVGSDVTIAGPLRVAPGSTLHIEAGGALRIAATGRIHLAPGARLSIEGTLLLEGPLLATPESTIETTGNGRIRAKRL